MVRRLLLKPPASSTSLTDTSATVVAQMEGETDSHPPDPKEKSLLKSWRHLSFAPGHENMMKKLFAEFFGTFWLVFGGCGSAILAAGYPELGIGFVGVSLAFGLTVLTMAYAVGHISGGHFNPAVSLGLAVARRFAWADLPSYWGAQVLGGLFAAFLLYLIASGAPDWSAGDFASNGYGELSPGGYGLMSAFLLEFVLTAFFLIIILGATCARAPAGFAPIAIGLGLTLVHLISIPVTNTSVNPARSTAVAFFAETGAVGQLRVFWLTPLLGAAAGAVIWAVLLSDRSKVASENKEVA